jgi:molecular chaperone GrpE
MTERDRENDREERQRIRITDKRRFRDTSEGVDPGAAPADEAGAASPGAQEGRPAEVGPVGGTAGVGETGDPADADLEAARAQAREYLDHLRRLQAEFDNYRKRVLKEQTHAIEMAAEPVVRRLLEVLDEFELALMAAAQKPDFDRFLHGVELVYAKLLDTLRTEGLERIEAEGKPFDPELHEALMQTGEGDGEPVVADVLRPGYTLKGRVIRPAGVRVSKE